MTCRTDSIDSMRHRVAPCIPGALWFSRSRSNDDSLGCGASRRPSRVTNFLDGRFLPAAVRAISWSVSAVAPQSRTRNTTGRTASANRRIVCVFCFGRTVDCESEFRDIKI